jgi:hypothetical protein
MLSGSNGQIVKVTGFSGAFSNNELMNLPHEKGSGSAGFGT